MEGKGMRLRPRPHDLRHTFAVRTLLDWYRAGEDVDPRMPELSTFLGHSDPASTYWYLEAVPELMARHQRPAGAAAGGARMSLLAPTLQASFSERLIAQLNASPHTIGSYRDASYR